MVSSQLGAAHCESQSPDNKANGSSPKDPSSNISNFKFKSVVDGWQPGKDPKVDHSGHFEFCGPWGVSAMMIGFPILMYYMWIGATFYGGQFPLPASGESFVDFLRHLAALLYEHAFPGLAAWKIYWTFFLIEAAFYCWLPGVQGYGKPLDRKFTELLSVFETLIPFWTSLTPRPF